jgi:hypothetical protein
MPKTMTACPDGKDSPADGTSRRTASGIVVPGRSRCTSTLSSSRSMPSFSGTSSASPRASRQRRSTSATAATASGMPSTPRVWNTHSAGWRASGQSLTRPNSRRSIAPTRPDDTAHAHAAVTAAAAPAVATSAHRRR